MNNLRTGLHHDRIDLACIAKTLIIGAIGGGIFFFFKLPLAWMLGAMVLTTLVAIGGSTLRVPKDLRGAMVMILGVLLGSTFTPDVLERITSWPITLACLALYLPTACGILFLYFTRVLGFDPVTAYFSATPGGFSEMVIIGGEAGGDERTIALIHGTRVLLVVMVIPFWFRYSTGSEALNGAMAGDALEDINWLDMAILVACIPAGVVLGKFARLPAHKLVGPMLVSAAVHIGGFTTSSPPALIVAIAQVVVGASVGARFAGVSVQRVLKTLLASLGSTTLMLLTTVGFAIALSSVTSFDLLPLVLAYSPGGLTEMSLVALALGVETAFVATHHIARIAIIVTAAPLVFKWFARTRL